MGTRICQIALFVLLFIPITSSAQTSADHWWSDQFHLSGLDGQVNCMVEYEGNLVIGGTFTSVDGTAFNRIVSWNGTTFLPLGDGLAHAPREFAVYNGELYVLVEGVDTLPSGTSSLVKWNHSEWLPVDVGGSASLTTIKAFGDRLFVAGKLSSVEGVPVNNIAQFDGLHWSSLGTGQDSTITAIGFIDDQLVAASAWQLEIDYTYFDRVNTQVWDGLTWTDMGFAPPIASAADLETYNGELYMVGPADETEKPLFARWRDSSWQLIDLGTNHYTSGPTYDLRVYDGKLYAAGWYTFDPAAAYHTSVIYWNGTVWQETETPFNGHAFSLCEFGGDLIAGGSFYQVGPHAAYRVARFHDNQWLPLSEAFTGQGLEGIIFAMCAKDAILVAGGTFDVAGQVAADNIAQFDGVKWSAMGDGFRNDIYSGDSRVEDIILYQDQFVACASRGHFVGWDGRTGSIARWNGTQWEILGDNAPSSTALAEYHGDLYCASGAAVYKFDGNTWSKQSPLMYGQVTKLVVFKGSLYAVGVVYVAMQALDRVMLRFDGTNWSTVVIPAGPMEIPTAQVYKNRLYLGGRFSSGLGGLGTIVSWNGSKWIGVSGTGGFTGFRVTDLTEFGGLLVAAGGVTYRSGADTCKFIAGFDGTDWQPLGSGIGVQWGVTLAPYAGGLAVGGPITTAGKKPSKGIALWQPDHDADNLLDGNDNCPFASNIDQDDATGDGIGDACCCQGITGDLNQSSQIDISDLSILITQLTVGLVQPLPCPNETNIDGTPGLSLSDLSALVAYLVKTPRPALPNCP